MRRRWCGREAASSSADKITIALDENDRARNSLAEGHPQLHASEGGGKISVTATRFEGALNADGQVENVVADGNVIGMRESPKDSDRFSAGHVEFAMLPGKNLIRDMTATGDVIAESQQGADSRVLKTAALRVKFGVGAGAATKGAPGAAVERQPSKKSKRSRRQRSIRTAETPQPRSPPSGLSPRSATAGASKSCSAIPASRSTARRARPRPR